MKLLSENIMKPWVWVIVLAIGLSGCADTETVTKKRWENNQTTLSLQDLTPQDSPNGRASNKLGLELENALGDSIFIVTDKEAQYLLKYKVTKYQEGNRLKRWATLGIDEGSRAMMTVKVALYNAEGVLAAWEVKSWVNGGPTGGSEDTLYENAAEDIIKHLKGY